MHRQQVIADPEEPRLFGAHPFRVPGHIHLGDPAILLQPVGAGVGNQAALQGGPLGEGFGGLATLRCQGEGKSAFCCEDHIAAGMVSHGGEGFSARLDFHLVGLQLPGPMHRSVGHRFMRL